MSLDQPVGDHDDTFFGEFLEDHREEDPLLEMGQSMLKTRIAEVLEALEYREREILRLRFGLADGYAYTLEEVGKIFSVTRERVRQIESKALRALQHPSPGKTTLRVRRAAYRGPVDFLPGRFAAGRGKRLAAALVAVRVDIQTIHSVGKPAMGFAVDRIVDDLNRAVAEGHLKTVRHARCRN